MKRLNEAVNEYLAMRRALGYKLQDAGTGLLDFASFLERQHASHITAKLAVQWAMQPSHAQPSWWATRLSFVRCFAQYWRATDPRTEVPAWDLLPFPARRAHPYIYTEEEIRRLLDAARSLRPTSGLRPWTYYCLLGLLAITGLRISEATALTPADVDLEEGLLTVRYGKLGKSRVLPIDTSTQRVLADYAHRRDSLFGYRTTPTFLVSDRGRRLQGSTVYETFYELSRQTGLRGLSDSHGPRLHDFRHRFAVYTLVRWYRSGRDVEPLLPILSTYLGHTHVSDTYWYLSACPELMGLATQRLEKRWEVRS